MIRPSWLVHWLPDLPSFPVAANCRPGAEPRWHLLLSGQAVEHQDALDQAIGMLHLADRLLVFVVPDALEPPVAVHARVEEILVDGGQLVLELGVQILDDLLIAFHSWGSSKVQLR